MDRRDFLAATAGAALLAGPAGAQTVISRPSLSRYIGTRYFEYATPGPFAAQVGNPKLVPVPVYERRADGSVVETSRRANVVVHVPLGAKEPLPAIVFSHAHLAEPVVYNSLLSHWASHGHIVVSPAHDDSLIENGVVARRKDAAGGRTWDLSRSLADGHQWSQRALAVSSLVDSLPVIARSFGVDWIDGNVAVAGHGYGAFVAQSLLGATAQMADGSRFSVVDPRFAAGLLLSPQGRGLMGLDDESWKGVGKPLLVAVGSRDTDGSGQSDTEKADAFRLSPPGYKHFFRFAAGDVGFYSGQSARPGSPQEALHDDLKAVTAAFLKAYLRSDRVAWEDVTDQFFVRLGEGRIDMRSR
jgi:hypothetical protein